MSDFEHIERARRELGWSIESTWLAYAGLGGNGSLADVTRFLRDGSGLTARQYDYLAQALNDGFVDGGGNHPVPYSGTMGDRHFDVD